MTKPKDPWIGGKPLLRRADREKEESKAIASIPPVGIIRKPVQLPPMERVQDDP